MLESRDKLAKSVFTILVDNFILHGEETLDRVRLQDPTTYLEIISTFLFEGFRTTKSKDIEKIIENVLTLFEQSITNVASNIK